MGAGSFPAGLGLCGLDPLPNPVPPRSVTFPVALQYDGQSKDFLLDANGEYLSIHPVDQAVALALILGLGTISSAPSAGAAFRQIKRITNTTPKQAEDMVRAALRDLVNAKKISIVTINVETRMTQGSTLIDVTYVNLVTKKSPTTISLPSGQFTGL